MTVAKTWAKKHPFCFHKDVTAAVGWAAPQEQSRIQEWLWGWQGHALLWQERTTAETLGMDAVPKKMGAVKLLEWGQAAEHYQHYQHIISKVSGFQTGGLWSEKPLLVVEASRCLCSRQGVHLVKSLRIWNSQKHQAPGGRVPPKGCFLRGSIISFNLFFWEMKGKRDIIMCIVLFWLRSNPNFKSTWTSQKPQNPFWSSL